MSFTDLLGDTLAAQGGKVVSTADALSGKTAVGFYFSAHWCPPCRRFTPMLAESYKKMKAAGKAFEIVFVSSDRDQGAFDGYFADMPWLALPWSDRDRKAALSKKFKIGGIPTLVILDGSDASVITADGREAVSGDQDGADFPWRPKPFKEIVGGSFVKNDGSVVNAGSLAGKTVGIYFSAHWCPPCRGFTPKLVETYNKVKGADGKPFEVIFASSDRDEAAFKEYFGGMPWLALPYAERKRKEELSNHFKVRGIPTFVLVDWDSGKVVNDKGRAAVSADPEGAEFPWRPKPVNDFAAGPGPVNEETCVVVLAEGCDAGEQARLLAELEKVAVPMLAAADAGGAPAKYAFMTAFKSGGIADRVRELVKHKETPKDVATLVLLDIPDGGAYYHAAAAGVVDEASVRAMLAAYEAKGLERKQLD